MANFYFNETYKQKRWSDMLRLRLSLGGWVGEIMNMALKDGIEDTVTFYLIGGVYLVPCSAILLAADKLKMREGISIASSYVGTTDEGFN
jgi:hypothetical protein